MFHAKSLSIIFYLVLVNSSATTSFSAYATSSNQNLSQLTVEEKRVSKAVRAMPSVVNRLDNRVSAFKLQLAKARNLTALTQLVIRHGRALWKESVVSFTELNDFDDRPLYWTRLKMTSDLRSSPAFSQLLTMQQERLLWQFELY